MFTFQLYKIKRNLFPFYKNKELRFVFSKIHEGFSSDVVTARFVGGCGGSIYQMMKLMI